MGRRHEVSDEQWERLKSLLPPEKSGKQGRPPKSNRLMLNGILWILRTGAPWRDLPKRFGPWQSVYSRFRRWAQRGVWTKVFEELSKDSDDETFMIDATIVRAHQDATGAKKTAERRGSAIPEADRPRRYTLEWTPWEIPAASCSPKDKSTT